MIDKCILKPKYDLRKSIIYGIIFVVIPLLLALGYLFFQNKRYNLVSVTVSVVLLLPFFIRFENHPHNARELVLIGVMTAISVVGRLIFAPLPAFKPVSAIVTLTGIAFGGQAGFVTGALTALISNMFFGQGPWTPLQMVVWGFIGLISGWIFFQSKKPNLVLICLFGAVAGGAYSVFMDLFWSLTNESGFSLSRFVAYLTTSLPFTLTYMISNVIFLFVLSKPILKKLLRVKLKYNVFRPSKNIQFVYVYEGLKQTN